jgi:hypothetical protein
VRHHATEFGCQPLGPRECPGCEDEAIIIGRERKLRGALKRALHQIEKLADAVEFGGTVRDARVGRAVAVRLAPLTRVQRAP